MKKENKKTKNSTDKQKFSDSVKIFLKHNYIYIIMIVAVILRVLLGYMMGGWHEVNALYDDGALMRGLSLERLTAPDEWALIKHLGFSVFLGITAISKLPYTVMLSLFWALAALTIYFLVRKLTQNKWIQLFSFLYVLFLPIAFTSWGGLRIYRNAIIAPAIILTLGLAMMVIVNIVKAEKIKKSVWTAILAGLAFSFTYFLKEDGIWLKICMLVILLVCVIIIGWRFFKEKSKNKNVIKNTICWLVISIIPFLVLTVSDSMYRKFNYHFFGVHEINTRTEGELGKFVYNIYKIDSPNRTAQVWAPYDAIEAAFEASPTLGEHPELLEKIMTTEWRDGDIKKNPISRDFLTWIMRTELVDSGLWTNEEEVNEFFKKVNNELAEAFKNGALKKAGGRIQLLESTGGYTWDEIMSSDLLSQIWATILDSNWFLNYEIGFYDEEVEYGTKGKEWDYTSVNKVLHMENDVNVIGGKKREIANVTGGIICVLYRIINTGLFVGLPVFMIGEIVRLVKNRKNMKKYIKDNGLVLSLALASFMLLGVTVAYSFATAWFFIEPAGTYHGPDGFVFYTVGVPGLLTLTYIAAIVGISKRLELLKKDKGVKNG